MPTVEAAVTGMSVRRRGLTLAFTGGLALVHAGCSWPLAVELVNKTAHTLRIDVEEWPRNKPCEAPPGKRCRVWHSSKITVATRSLRWEYEIPSQWWFGSGGPPRSDPFVEPRGLYKAPTLSVRIEADGTLTALKPKDRSGQANPQQPPGYPARPVSTKVIEGPTCAEVAAVLFGLSLGPVKEDYHLALRGRIVREGTAEVVAGVGFEKLKGRSDGVDYVGIMAFFDRGRFIGTTATARMKSEPDHGFGKIVAAVSTAANAKANVSEGRATFACEGGLELTVEPTTWKNKPQVGLSLMDRGARKRMQDYIEQYCADPAKRRPQDACK